MEELQHIARDFYKELYTTEPVTPCDPSTFSFPILAHSDKRLLNHPVSATEVTQAIRQMGAFKAPRPDGLSPLFFQKNWHVVGEEVENFFIQAFQEGKFPDDINGILIILIPKQESPEQIS